MKNKIWAILSIGILTNITGCSQTPVSKDVSELTFSNTQKWYQYADRILNRHSFLIETSDLDLTQVKLPPKNNSEEVRNEVDYLIELQAKRTPDDIKKIVSEFGFCGWNMGGYKLGLLEAQDDFLIKLLYDASKVGFTLKKKFDRVRPSLLDNRIVPGIDVPMHASYPSNHSLESHFLALVLADLYPQFKSEFWQAADTIAYDRELAGVHYPSDSAVGAEVAKLIFEKVSKLSTYQKFIKENRNPKRQNFIVRDPNNQASICDSLVKKNVPN